MSVTVPVGKSPRAIPVGGAKGRVGGGEAGARPWPWAVAGTSPSSAADTASNRRMSADPLDRRDAAVAMAEHELDQAAPAGEVARADAAAELVARLGERRAHDRRLEAPGLDLHALRAGHLAHA